MPRTMLTDEHWSRLKPILLDLNIYDKPNLRNILEAMLFRLRAGCPWRDISENVLVRIILSLKLSDVGLSPIN